MAASDVRAHRDAQVIAFIVLALASATACAPGKTSPTTEGPPPADSGAGPDDDSGGDGAAGDAARPDSGRLTDAGTSTSSGLYDASGAVMDSGPVADAGVIVDAAAPVDASQPADAGDPMATDPSAAGPYDLDEHDDSVSRDQRDTPVTAHLPEPTGTERFGLVVFVPGFRLESSRYEPLAERIASHGFVVVRADPPDPLFGIDHVEMALDVTAVIDWALADATVSARLLPNPPIAVMGHSLGGKVTTMTANRDARVAALLGLDPVNAGHPVRGYSAELPDIVPDELSALAIPVGFVGETTNSMGSGLSPACAPTDQNFATFYDAAMQAPWAASWELQGADHMDFVDDRASCGLVCSACPDGPADDADVQAAVHTLAAAFIRRHLAGDTAMDAWLTGNRVPSLATVQRRP